MFDCCRCEEPSDTASQKGYAPTKRDTQEGSSYNLFHLYPVQSHSLHFKCGDDRHWSNGIVLVWLHFGHVTSTCRFCSSTLLVAIWLTGSSGMALLSPCVPSLLLRRSPTDIVGLVPFVVVDSVH